MRLLILFILLIPRITFGQDINSTDRHGANNVYTDAIKHYLTFLEDKGNIKQDTFIIELKGHYLDSITPIIKDTYMQFANSADIDKLLEKGNSFVLNGISPLSFDNGRFYISIVPFVSTKDRGDGVRLEVSGGSKIIYSFDSKNRNFKFIKVENWGI